ncbi:MAG: SDR family oxidoreductase [Actinobacteria bacterium]|jgi:NAD(P)-dependent dehydrogenase (short-subunit alcohol dehydrogenase family)|nr:MAG: SDR family oxidoreductase [Actinomycetota bacterium]
MTEHGVNGRVIIVTGAGRGIGRGIVRHLAKNGATVAIAEFRRNLLDEATAEMTELGAPNLGVECNVGSQESVFDMVDQVHRRFGRVDALVNNAQRFRPTMPLEEVTENDMDVLHRTGTLGTLWGMQAVFPHMKAQGWGRIVNVGSSNGIRGAAGYGPYNASKEAIRALTRTAAREWAKYGIVTNCYCPAAAGAWDKPADDDIRADAWDAMYRRHPMSRDGEPEEDIAPVVLFLCSDASRFLNGETLMIDGGGYMTA